MNTRASIGTYYLIYGKIFFFYSNPNFEPEDILKAIFSTLRKPELLCIMVTIEERTIIQHNVLAWTTTRANDLSNYYQAINLDIMILNSIWKIGKKIIKLYGYNKIQKILIMKNKYALRLL